MLDNWRGQEELRVQEAPKGKKKKLRRILDERTSATEKIEAL